MPRQAIASAAALAAINNDDLAGDPASSATGKEQRRIRDFLGRAEPPRSNARNHDESGGCGCQSIPRHLHCLRTGVEAPVRTRDANFAKPEQASSGLIQVAGLRRCLLSGGGFGKLVGNAAKVGAVAAIGGLAYSAWQTHQKRQGGAQPNPEAFTPPPQADDATEELGTKMVRAMVAAAKADGQIDAGEKERIFSQLETMPLSVEEKAFVFDELSGPLNLDAVVAGADTPEHAADIYAASLVAETEREYLSTLANRLRLEAGLVAEIHRAAGHPPLALLDIATDCQRLIGNTKLRAFQGAQCYSPMSPRPVPSGQPQLVAGGPAELEVKDFRR